MAFGRTQTFGARGAQAGGVTQEPFGAQAGFGAAAARRGPTMGAFGAFGGGQRGGKYGYSPAQGPRTSAGTNAAFAYFVRALQNPGEPISLTAQRVSGLYENLNNTNKGKLNQIIQAGVQAPGSMAKQFAGQQFPPSQASRQRRSSSVTNCRQLDAGTCETTGYCNFSPTRGCWGNPGSGLLVSGRRASRRRTMCRSDQLVANPQACESTGFCNWSDLRGCWGNPGGSLQQQRAVGIGRLGGMGMGAMGGMGAYGGAGRSAGVTRFGGQFGAGRSSSGRRSSRSAGSRTQGGFGGVTGFGGAEQQFGGEQFGAEEAGMGFA